MKGGLPARRCSPARRLLSARHPGSAPWLGTALGAASALLLGACTVGPDYKGPPVVAADALGRAGFLRARLAGVDAAPPPARWWESVGDPLLTRLIDDAFAASPTLASAAARIREARAQQLVNRASLLPTGGTSASYVRARIPTGNLGTASASGGTGSTGGGSSLPDPLKIDVFSVSADAIWELDIFGGTRRSIESAGAAIDARQALFEDAQVQLASDMARAYVLLREAQVRDVSARRLSELRDKTIDVLRQRRARGTASEGELQQAIDQSAQERAGLPASELAIEQQLDQVALLAGREPGAYDALLEPPKDVPVAQPLPPADVPVGDPAAWLQRRPDIRAAERRLASSTATIGQNIAGYFPKIRLIGFIGSSGPHPGDLFKGMPTSVLAPSLSWNFLDIPTTRARVAGAEASRDEAIADYRSRLLSALQDANGALSRFGRTRTALAERQTALDAAARAAELTRQRLDRGTATLVELYDAERERSADDSRLAQARSDLMQAYVALQKSLGLGWGAPPPNDGTSSAAMTAGSASIGKPVGLPPSTSTTSEAASSTSTVSPTPLPSVSVNLSPAQAAVAADAGKSAR